MNMNKGKYGRDNYNPKSQKGKKKGSGSSCLLTLFLLVPTAILVFSLGMFMGGEFATNDSKHQVGVGGPAAMVNNNFGQHISPNQQDDQLVLDPNAVPAHAPMPGNDDDAAAIQAKLAAMEAEVAQLQLQKEREALQAQLAQMSAEKAQAEQQLRYQQEQLQKANLRGGGGNQEQQPAAQNAYQPLPAAAGGGNVAEEQEPLPQLDEELLTGNWDGLDATLGGVYAKLNSPLDFPTVSVALWAKLGQNTAREMHTLVSNKDVGCQQGNRGFALFVNEWETNDGQVVLEWGDDSMGCHKLRSGGRTFAVGRWHHVAFVLSGQQATLYLDGEEVGSSASLRSSVARQNLFIGQMDGGNYPWGGHLSGLVVWDAALTRGQVRQVMGATAGNRGQNRLYPSPRAFLPLAEAAGADPDQRVKDVEGHTSGQYFLPPKPVDWAALAGGGGGGALDQAASDALGRKRADAIRAGFKHAWDGYKAHAWGADEVKPQSGRRNENWGGMAVTMVDALDTIWLMGLKDEFWEARDYIKSHLSFGKTGQVSVFETTIRSLGGLLSAYDLSGDKVFLTKAEDLGARLAKAFNTNSGIPYSTVHLQNGHGSTAGWTGGNAILSELGTLQVEFRYLSKATGNMEYGRKATKVFEQLRNKPTTNGLVPIYVSINSGNFQGSKITFGALGDSYYEYLLKTWLQGGRREGYLREMYDAAVQGVHDKLVQRTTPSGFLYLADLEGGRVKHKMDHLACFMAATLALGAHTDPQGADSPRAQRDMQVAKELGHTCYQMYRRTATGLSPEYVEFRAGADIVNPSSASFYILRPEAVEALFYLYWFTKDHTYREWSWEIFQAIEKHCRTSIAYGAHPDVRNTGRKPDDRMESFFLAETFKYLYLIQDPDQPIDLYEYVFNTEAHPMKVFKDGWP